MKWQGFADGLMRASTAMRDSSELKEGKVLVEPGKA
jgi:hypothetical protein